MRPSFLKQTTSKQVNYLDVTA